MGTYIGIDLGRMHDSTAMVVAELDQEGVVTVRANKELRNTPFEAQIAVINADAKRWNPVVIWIDSTGLGLPKAERLRTEIGSRLEPVTFTQNSKAKLVSRTLVLLQDRRLKFGSHPRLREQLHSITKETTADGRVLYRTDASEDLTGEHHGDLALALMLAVTGIRESGAGVVDVSRLYDSVLAGLSDAPSSPSQMANPAAPPPSPKERIKIDRTFPSPGDCLSCGLPIGPNQAFRDSVTLRGLLHSDCPPVGWTLPGGRDSPEMKRQRLRKEAHEKRLAGLL